ncbi:MAG: PfkB family carbohydrate kinase [Candidatus Aerophobetes bacterium]|nr:PfkB family carbohydrate kinase [Candidatus Aerophobetes bacterium]
MVSQKFDVVLVGHFSKDKNLVDGEEKNRPGGAVYYGAFPLKLMGINVAVVTKVAREDLSELADFEKNDIPVFVKESSQTTEVKNIYSTKKPDKRQHYLLEFAGPFNEENFPDVEAEIIHIGALMRGEVPLDLVKSLSKKADLSLDVQGFVRARESDRLVIKDWEEKDEALPYVKYLKTDMVEAEILTGSSEIRSAAKNLAELGPSEILITHKDGAVLFAQEKFYQAPFTPKSLKGRTGRGDTCMATYIGKRLSLSAPKALRFAAGLTTIKLEKEGPFKGKLEDVETLLK